MDERGVRVLGQLAGVCRDCILRDVARPQRLGDRRPRRLRVAARGGRGCVVVWRAVREVRVWRGGGVRGLVRAGDWGEQRRGRVCEEAHYGDARRVDKYGVHGLLKLERSTSAIAHV